MKSTDKVYNEFFEDGNEPAASTSFVDWIPGGSHVEITCIATTNLSARKVVRPAGLKYGPGEGAVTGSPGVWAGNTLYVSGLGPAPTGGTASAAVGDQVHQMAKNHVLVLDDAGLKLDDIVCGFVYLSDMKDYAPDECRVQGVLLPRPRRAHLPDARLGHRQDRRTGPGGVCGGADKVDVWVVGARYRSRNAAEIGSRTTKRYTSAAATATAAPTKSGSVKEPVLSTTYPVITGANEPPKYPPKFWIEPSDAT